MANSYIFLAGALLLLCVAERAGAGVLKPSDYAADQLLAYQPSQRQLIAREDLDAEFEIKCCAKCIYIPGYGCYDPTDPSEYPPVYLIRI